MNTLAPDKIDIPISGSDDQWRWNILPALVRAAFVSKPDLPLPLWAQQNIFLDRKVTTRPGYYDPDEFPWTWEFQEILRTRQVTEVKLTDGSIVIVDLAADVATNGCADVRTSLGEASPHPDFVDVRARAHPAGSARTVSTVRQLTVMKSSVGGFTEGALNEVRYAAVHDPQNVIFAIDSRVEAGNINEIRLQPTLRKLGEKIFTDDDDDAGKFLLKLRRMIVYFFGSYSAGVFANKMAELAIADELEEHGQPSGDTSNVENLRSRIKSAQRGLLVLISKPKLSGGPIDIEHKKGSTHIPEVPCPHCGKHQELVQENMIFSHCKMPTGEWDFDRMKRETWFRCIHCGKAIEEKFKHWMNDRKNRRWRRSNENAEPGHISMQVSDFLSYLISWGELAIKYVTTKGDPIARQGYRNHHEGKPYEIRATKTALSDILLLRGDHSWRIIPWKPDAILLGGDVGLTYTKWGVIALRRTSEMHGEAALIDRGKELHPDDVLKILDEKRYLCRETGEKIGITMGGLDAKYRKDEVYRACLRSRRRLIPMAGISADLAVRPISFNEIPTLRKQYGAIAAGFGLIVYVDRDAKHELYIERIAAWVDWLKAGQPTDKKPPTARFWWPQDVDERDDFLIEHTKENLVELPGFVHAAKRFVWKRTGDNEGGDISKVIFVLWRYLTRNDPTHAEPQPITPPTDDE